MDRPPYRDYTLNFETTSGAVIYHDGKEEGGVVLTVRDRKFPRPIFIDFGRLSQGVMKRWTQYGSGLREGGGEGLHVLLVLDIFDIAPTVGYNISTS